MVKNFKFFHGIIRATLTVTLGPQEHVDIYAIDAEAELTRLVSERISEEIDSDIIRQLTTLVGDVDQIAIRNVNADYLQRYLDMGENRA